MTVLCFLLLALPTAASAATLSAYCHCARCCGSANAPAANGRPPVVGLTVAGPRWIPLGTWIYIEGIGRRLVTDRLASAFDDRFDLFVANHQTAKQFGVQQRRITLLK